MSEHPEPIPDPEHASRLRETAEFLRAVVETAVDAIITIDDRGIIRTVNPATERMFGYQRQEMIGQNVSMLMPQPHRAQHDQYLQRYQQTGEAHIIGIGREVEGLRKDGGRFPLHLAVSQMDVDGRRMFAGILRDITQHKRDQEQMRQAREAAEAANRAKDQFLAVLSHELRTPLTPALATLSLLTTRDDLPADLQDLLDMARRNVEMEARLIDDLLDLTRVSRGKLQLHFQTLDVHAVLDDVVGICRHDLDAKGIHLTTRLNAAAHFVQADPARLRQVFWNLLKNAAKFTPKGGQVTIISWNQPADLLQSRPLFAPGAVADALLVQVKDTGVGIAPEVLPRIFDAFEQGGTHVTRQFGGLGLGLAISRALTVMHGGTLTAHSEGSGQGAAFTLELPAVSPPPSGQSDSPQTTAMAHDTRPLRVLVVDDHVDTARVLNMLLTRMGHHVTTADSVASALETISQKPFDLLISDIGLPDGSGLDLMREARLRGLRRGIAVSGYGMEQDIQRSREAGFADHLTKPLDLPALRRAIAEVTASTDHP